MEDIAPKLLEEIQKDFQKRFDKSQIIASLYERVRDGTTTYIEAHEYAIEVGNILAEAYQNNLSSSVLPEGRLYYNIAKRIIEPTMINNYDVITDVTQQVQTTLNQSANIGIKAIKPELNQDRIEGIIDKVSDAIDFEEVAWLLDEPIKNFSQSIVDDSIRANAEFQAKAGLTPIIIRKVAGNCCDWCKAVAGTYTYPDDVPKDVYRRHQRCRCVVDYNPGKGKVQNVHTKQWRSEEERDKIEARKTIGIQTLNSTDKAALNQYKSFESYLLNEALRVGYELSEEQKAFMRNLDNALEKLPSFEGVTYRSLDSYRIRDLDAFWEKYQEGNVVSEKAYTSTSAEIYDDTFDIQMIIVGKSGRDLRGYTELENEILYPRDVEFIVSKVEGDTIWLEER